MQPIVVDSSIWIEWFNGKLISAKEEVRNRILYLPSIVVLELFSGVKNKKHSKFISSVADTFERNGRIISPNYEDYKAAGLVLAKLGWPASKKANDAMVCVSARKIGAEVWTLDQGDFEPIAKILHVKVTIPSYS